MRPKRSATINKSYTDTIDESIFEERAPGDNKKTTTKKGRDSNVSNQIKKNSNENSIPFNWQPKPALIDYFSCRLDLADAYVDFSNQALFCPHQQPIVMSYNQLSRRRTKEPFHLKKGDYIYMISEPPGEPYYIGRIMGFREKNGSSSKSEGINFQDFGGDSKTNQKNHMKNASDCSFQIQWFYRPRDISKFTSSSRLLFASMHSDTCPLESFRGLVKVRHKQDIEDDYKLPPGAASKNQNNNFPSLSALEYYTQHPNCFYFDKLFDRYMMKFYDVILTASLLKGIDYKSSKCINFLRALNKRYEYIFVESRVSKSFISGFVSGSCNCEACGQWCSNQESVSCAVCAKWYHMYCLDPPLLKKPSRGFSWTCVSCTKKVDIENHAKRMVMLSHDNKLSNEVDIINELKDLKNTSLEELELGYDKSKLEDFDALTNLPKYELMAIDFLQKTSDTSLEQRRLQEEWCMHYLGVHAKLEDGVDLEDRSPYPRASTRIGPKYQATVIPDYVDHPLVYYDLDKPNTTTKTSKKSSLPKKAPLKAELGLEDSVKLAVPEKYKNVEPLEYPQWLQPRPKGYIERGVDDGKGVTCTLMWKPSDADIEDNFEKLDNYIAQCALFAEKIGVFPNSPNFCDAILRIYQDQHGDMELSLREVSKLTKKALGEPILSKEEVKRFEGGVKKYGSELYPVYKMVKTKPLSAIVRFYYLWKKTSNGRLIWGNFEGRLHRKLQNIKGDQQTKDARSSSEVDDFADEEDDSSYESEKILEKKKKFTCKHCLTQQSIRWFRITGYDANTVLDKNLHEEFDKDTIIALCFRCARLWRRYAVFWEDPIEIDRKYTKVAGTWRKKIDFELVRDSVQILQEAEENGGLSYGSDIEKPSSAITDQNQHYKKPNKKTTAMKNGNLKKGSSPEQNKEELNQPKKSNKKSQAETVKTNSEKANTGNKKAEKTSSKTSKRETDTSVRNVKKGSIKKEASDIVDDDTFNESKRSKSKRKTKLLQEDDRKPNTEDSNANQDIVDINAQLPPAKKQKTSSNPALSTCYFNPVFNSDYRTFSPLSIFDYRKTSSIDDKKLKEIVQNYNIHQLLDMHSQLAPFLISNSIMVKTPFKQTDRKCCVCMEEHLNDTNLDMLICSNCGVNVHLSCSGVSIPEDVPKPLNQWLCERCINDISPTHSTIYSCCLCLANETNYELSILGHPSVKPDYLKPINDTGKWCHLICSMFGSEYVSFRPQPLNFANRRKNGNKFGYQEPCQIIESMNNFVAIESVNHAYMSNYKSRCGICEVYNGMQVPCGECLNSSQCANSVGKYHITCAQDTLGFRLCFVLIGQHLDRRDPKLVKVCDKVGILKPVLLCPEHSSSTSLYSMRAGGKRFLSIPKDDERPLIQLYLEDLLKDSLVHNRLSGPQFRANNYISMLKLFQEKEASSKPRVWG